MRYYLGQCDYKWTHARTKMEQLWIERKVTSEVFKEVEHAGWDWVLHRSKSPIAGDIYCRCDIFVETDDTKYATFWALKYPNFTRIQTA